LTAPELRVVAAWHEALNAGDADRLVELSHPEIEVGGPRGTGRGASLLREWVERAGIRLDPLRVFHEAETVVVEQEARWRSPETGEMSGSQVVASSFVVRDGRVASVSRFSDLSEALRAAGLGGSQEVSGAAGAGGGLVGRS
jgi:ketosteroid isomerase-like protein